MKGIIIYSSKYGCTEKAVKILQSKMAGGVKAVNVAKEKAPDLSTYDTVILGSPIYVGKTLKKLTAYMRQNLEVLKTKKVALFVCAGEQDPARSEKQINSAFPQELCNAAVVRESFGGDLHWGKLDWFTKLMLGMVMGIKEGYSRLSEEKINHFAKAVSDVHA